MTTILVTSKDNSIVVTADTLLIQGESRNNIQKIIHFPIKNLFISVYGKGVDVNNQKLINEVIDHFVLTNKILDCVNFSVKLREDLNLSEDFRDTGFILGTFNKIGQPVIIYSHPREEPKIINQVGNVSIPRTSFIMHKDIAHLYDLNSDQINSMTEEEIIRYHLNTLREEIHYMYTRSSSLNSSFPAQSLIIRNDCTFCGSLINN